MFRVLFTILILVTTSLTSFSQNEAEGQFEPLFYLNTSAELSKTSSYSPVGVSRVFTNFESKKIVHQYNNSPANIMYELLVLRENEEFEFVGDDFTSKIVQSKDLKTECVHITKNSRKVYKLLGLVGVSEWICFNEM